MVNRLFVSSQFTCWPSVQAWIRDDEDGPVYAAAVPRQALVQEGGMPYTRPDGEQVAVRAVLCFLEPVDPTVAAGRVNPIDHRDVFTTPSGITGRTIVAPGLMTNPETSRPYAAVVRLA